MAKGDNILRIKINGESLIKFSKQHGGRDFLISYPLIHQGESESENHFSFHTPNGRITFKVTSLKDKGKETLTQAVALVKNNPLYKNKIVPSGLDLFKELKLLDFKNPKEIYPWGKIALNLKDSILNEFFGPTKTPDREFKVVKNIEIPSEKDDQITIKFGIAKNFSGDLTGLKGRYDDIVQVEEYNHIGDKYTFFFFIEYSFPNIPKQDTKV